MRYKVVKEFPGLKVGDILTEEEGTGFYVNKKEDLDVSETSEELYINSVALSKSIVESERAYFAPIAEKKKVVEKVPTKVDRMQKVIDEMSQVAAMFEADLVTAINDYHYNLITKVISEVYEDIDMLTKLKQQEENVG